MVPTTENKKTTDICWKRDRKYCADQYGSDAKTSSEERERDNQLINQVNPLPEKNLASCIQGYCPCPFICIHETSFIAAFIIWQNRMPIQHENRIKQTLGPVKPIKRTDFG
jgi:hypothetical protein